MPSGKTVKTWLIAIWQAFRMHVVPFDESAAYAFAQLRAQYARLAPPDAIQLGCASVAAVDLFITNDRGLARYIVPRVSTIRALADVEVGRS
jgi:predicted nucleic acid-binding protein